MAGPSRPPDLVPGRLTAVIWDFDGTLVDTRTRNYNVVRRLLAEAAGRDPATIPALASSEVYDRVNRSYRNWRDLYEGEFGFTAEETDRLGRLWTRYQLADHTAAPVFEGIGTVLAALRFVPHGVVSMNGRDQIFRSLREANLYDAIHSIVGWEDVDIRRQKPDPDGLLACIERVTGFAPGVVLYVGDHETDVRCAAAARQALAAAGRAVGVVSVGARFTGGTDGWPEAPDYLVRHPHEVMDVARRIAEEP